jgi:hypothetical protein
VQAKADRVDAVIELVAQKLPRAKVLDRQNTTLTFGISFDEG